LHSTPGDLGLFLLLYESEIKGATVSTTCPFSLENKKEIATFESNGRQKADVQLSTRFQASSSAATAESCTGVSTGITATGQRTSGGASGELSAGRPSAIPKP
jgi:hypothetical protein